MPEQPPPLSVDPLTSLRSSVPTKESSDACPLFIVCQRFKISRVFDLVLSPICLQVFTILFPAIGEFDPGRDTDVEELIAEGFVPDILLNGLNPNEDEL